MESCVPEHYGDLLGFMRDRVRSITYQESQDLHDFTEHYVYRNIDCGLIYFYMQGHHQGFNSLIFYFLTKFDQQNLIN